MADIFISYKKEDIEKVRPIAEALEEHGLSVWWDPKLRTGTVFSRKIKKALSEARAVIVVWSSKSVESDWVVSEAEIGRKRKILFPINIEKKIEPPPPFNILDSRSIINWDGKDKSLEFEKLLSDLKYFLDSAIEEILFKTSYEKLADENQVLNWLDFDKKRIVIIHDHTDSAKADKLDAAISKEFAFTVMKFSPSLYKNLELGDSYFEFFIILYSDPSMYAQIHEDKYFAEIITNVKTLCIVPAGWGTTLVWLDTQGKNFLIDDWDKSATTSKTGGMRKAPKRGR